MWKPNQAGPNSPSTPEPARPAPPASTPTSFEPGAVRPATGAAASAAIPDRRTGHHRQVPDRQRRGLRIGVALHRWQGRGRHQPARQPRHRRPQRPGRGQHHRPRGRCARQGPRQRPRQRSRRHPQRRLAHRRRRRRAHLHRGRRVLQGRNRHPQARRHQERRRPHPRTGHRRSKSLTPAAPIHTKVALANARAILRSHLAMTAACAESDPDPQGRAMSERLACSLPGRRDSGPARTSARAGQQP